jgi:hypothetical protein
LVILRSVVGFNRFCSATVTRKLSGVFVRFSCRFTHTGHSLFFYYMLLGPPWKWPRVPEWQRIGMMLCSIGVSSLRVC